MAAAVSSGYRMPRSPAMPQQGMPVGRTSLAHSPATFMNESSNPIFLLLHGTCIATLSFTCWKSSLSSMNSRMNSTGSYNEKRRALSESPCLIYIRQGLVSITIGSFPPSDASIKAFSSSLPLALAASLNPRELKIIPQH